MKLSAINEGAWGHGPLDNDSASDQKWDIAKKAISDLDDQMMNKSDPDSMYHAVGLWLDLVDKLETQYSYFTDDVLAKNHALAREAVKWLLENPDELINHYEEPDKVEDILRGIRAKIHELEENLPDVEHSDGAVQ